MQLFTFSIGVAILLCDVLPVSHSYSHDEMDMVIFVLMASYIDDGVVMVSALLRKSIRTHRHSRLA